MVAGALLQLGVELLGVAAAEVGDLLDAEQPQVAGQRGAYAGDRAQFVRWVVAGSASWYVATSKAGRREGPDRRDTKAGGGSAAGRARRARAARPLLGFGALLDRASHQFESLLRGGHDLAEERQQDAAHVLMGREARTPVVERIDDERMAPVEQAGELELALPADQAPRFKFRTRARKLAGFRPGATMVRSRRWPTRGTPAARTMNGFHSG